ncbi:MAG: bifunctional UDP-N-acetylglucosamine diphosphorylase/glucosamine-1-phosphate N-acetyltransferase GlmU [bacterium]
MKNLAVVILAAGEGKRMKSGRAKVLHPLLGRPMVSYPLKVARSLKPEKTVVVVGVQAEEVKAAIKAKDVSFALQKEQKGTGHALMSAMPALKGFQGDVLVIYGDGPCLRSDTLKELVKLHRKRKAEMSLLTVEMEDPGGYGRILRDEGGRVQGIVEHKDCTPSQRKIKEANPGLYCYRMEFLKDNLKKLGNDNRQKEYYLTDLVEMAVKQGRKVPAAKVGDPCEVLGINSKWELARVEGILKERINQEHCNAGVTIQSPESVHIEPAVKIEADAVIEPGARLSGTTRIGKGAVIEMNTRLTNTVVEEKGRIKTGSVLEDCTVKTGAQVGPMAHIRPGSVIGKEAKIGNFVETKKAHIGEGAKISHLSYVGDADIGRRVNIGCGFITCNYDGTDKWKTVVEDDAFVGSDTQTVAPVTIGKGAYIGSGSTITEDVPPGALSMTRAPQLIKEDWVKKKSAKAGSKKTKK